MVTYKPHPPLMKAHCYSTSNLVMRSRICDDLFLSGTATYVRSYCIFSYFLGCVGGLGDVPDNDRK